MLWLANQDMLEPFSLGQLNMARYCREHVYYQLTVLWTTNTRMPIE